MVAYSFKAMFEGPILSGRKPHTMRNDRKRHARPGEILQLYSGMRTRHCRLIGTATCVSVLPVRLDFEEERIEIGADRIIEARLDLDSFAWSDGFLDWNKLVDFWRAEHAAILRWSGVIIAWNDLHKAETSPRAPLKLRKVKP